MNAVAFTLAIGFLASTCGAQQTWPTEPTPSSEFECPNRDEGFYRHPTDCGAYYHCTNGYAWYMECSPGLYFNPETNLCDWPWNVDCENEATTEEAEVRDFSETQDFECDPEVNGAFPHEEDCQKYYDCWNGTATLLSCSDLMLFDLKYAGCNFAQDVDCGNRTRPGGVPTQKPPPEPTTPAGPVPTEEPGFECPKPEGLFEDPEDCASFYQCYGEISWHQRCSPNLYFVEAAQSCDYLENVDCGDRPILDLRMNDEVAKMVN